MLNDNMRALRWFGHVERDNEDDGWLKKCTKMEMHGVKPVGRPVMKWEEVIRVEVIDDDEIHLF